MERLLFLKPYLSGALALGIPAASAGVFLLAHGLAFRLLLPLAARAWRGMDTILASRLKHPTRLAAALFGLDLGLSLSPVPGLAGEIAGRASGLAWIASLAWIFVSATQATEDVLARRVEREPDNAQALKFLTQYKILQRILLVAATVLAGAAMLMSFERLRGLGAGILASAGLAGVVVGLSAQRTVSAILAGIQVAATQPFKMNDVVVIEGEWGRIEEIAFTYVVLKTWDLRRLIIPITYFIEKPFQNWTRTSSKLLCPVVIHADYATPVDEVRRELERICREEAPGLWNRETCVLQVTETNQDCMELRALVSADDSSRAWDLRCLVRERLVAFLQSSHPGCLPVQRRKILS